jgi:hypothetical protein
LEYLSRRGDRELIGSRFDATDAVTPGRSGRRRDPPSRDGDLGDGRWPLTIRAAPAGAQKIEAAGGRRVIKPAAARERTTEGSNGCRITRTSSNSGTRQRILLRWRCWLASRRSRTGPGISGEEPSKFLHQEGGAGGVFDMFWRRAAR